MEASPTKKTVYKHGDHGIDPRDPHMVTHDKNKKWLICEASELGHAGAAPKYHKGLKMNEGWYVSVWSPKFNIWVQFKENPAKRRVRNDEIVAEIYEPHWQSVHGAAEVGAMKAFEGYELHIIND